MKLLSISQKSRQNADSYPFNIPIVKDLTKLEFTKPITIIVGENGTGKSTLIESIAVATGLPTIGADDTKFDSTLNAARKLAKLFKLSWKLNNHRGFFMRAEDFFGFQKRISEEQQKLRSQKEEFEGKFTGYGRLLSVGSTVNQLENLEKRYGENPDAFSHGESFLNLFNQRLVPDGLYILDEPEVPLSPTRQLSLISLIKEQINNNSQFIIATHSPILMALPDAQIIEVDSEGNLNEVNYEDLEHVTLMRDFLNNPNVFINRL